MAAAELLLLVVSVPVCLVADTRVPCLVRVERAEAAASGTASSLQRRLVRAGGGPAVAVFYLAYLIVDPADDAAGCRLRNRVWAVFLLPR